MQAVVLAGGKGTRLRPLTFHIPKAMVPIHNKPFLRHQLEMITSFGVTEVLLLVGYLGNKIEEYFGDGSELGLRIRYSCDDPPRGTGGALKNAEGKVAEEFLLINGDTFLPIDYRELIESFHRHDKIGIIVVYDNSETIATSNVAIGESNLVADYNKQDSRGMTHVDSGVMVFKKQELLRLIPEGQACSLEEDILQKLIAQKELAAFPTSQRFYDIGDVERLELIKEILE